MINFIKRLFGLGPQVDYKALVGSGAIIVDVRTRTEYAGGHINGSVNFPLDMLANNIAKLKKGKAVITCCASGMRSASAKSILNNNGFSEVYNGGSWTSLDRKIKR